MKKLTLYTEKDILPAENCHTYMLFPSLGNYLKKSGDPDAERFDRFCSEAGDYFNWTNNPEESDYFLLPFNFSFDPLFHNAMSSFLEKAKKFNKKTILFFNSDDDRNIDLKDVIIFRTSFYRSKKAQDTFALPGWSLDFENYFPDKKFSILSYQEKPSVSYCGYIDNRPQSIKAMIKGLLKNEPLNYEVKARQIRGKACEVLKKNNQIESNFIIRNGFWAEGMDDKNKARQEYAQNMINSLYGIVTRGGGNFSYRLYEILSCGRIPIFIDTDSMLPFDTIIDWKKHLVWLEERDLDQIDKVLLAFHKSKSPEQLKEIQESNRKLYIEYISPTGFFNNLVSIL